MQVEATIEISVNGELMQVPEGLSVGGLLTLLDLSDKKAAVELNLAIVPRSMHAGTRLQPGDKLEIVHFVGGG
jgi:sulfur carrier protein